MKLIFDQNLSPQLVSLLSDLYPNSAHVFTLGLAEAADHEIYEYARALGFVVVTKDADFSDLCEVRGFPPKVIWIRIGNCSVKMMEALLRSNYFAIALFESDPFISVLALF